MKFTVTYVRTLTLEEEFEANTPEEAQDYAEKRLSGLANREYADAELEAEIIPAEGETIQIGPW